MKKNFVSIYKESFRLRFLTHFFFYHYLFTVLIDAPNTNMIVEIFMTEQGNHVKINFRN